MASASTFYAMSATSGGGEYQRAIIGTGARDIITGTEMRDLSPMLDLLALADTPFINEIGWGAESGGNSIEWMSEDLGPGMVKNVSAMVSANASMVLNSIDGLNASQAIKQLQQGTVIYAYNSDAQQHEMLLVTCDVATVSITLSELAGSGFSALVSHAANDDFYILGAYANEGSRPRTGNVRHRALHSNYFTILRQDVQITGTMKNTDMYVIGREDLHQIDMRLKEMQRERERTALLSARIAKTSLQAGMMDGVLGFLLGQSGTHIDATTTALTEDALNSVVTAIWENGGRNLSFWGSISQVKKFTEWDSGRIRTTVNERIGGGYLTRYLTEPGIELALHPLAKFPINLCFVLDTSRIRLIPKRNRKAIMEKLGKRGDVDEWQMLSEFSMEMKGYNLGQHGIFSKLRA